MNPKTKAESRRKAAKLSEIQGEGNQSTLEKCNGDCRPTWDTVGSPVCRVEGHHSALASGPRAISDEAGCRSKRAAVAFELKWPSGPELFSDDLEPLGERLPAKSRLRHTVEIKRAQNNGLKVAGDLLVMVLLPNDRGIRRLGVTVSRKVGNAVVRTRVKRLLREIFRHNRKLVPASTDLVIIARTGAARQSHQALLKSFEATALRAKRRISADQSRRGVE